MERTGALDYVLRRLVANDAGGAVDELTRAHADSPDAYLLGLRAFSHFVAQQFEAAAGISARAIREATDAEAVQLARAAAGMARSGWPIGPLAPGDDDHILTALGELDTVAGIEPQRLAFIHYLLAEAALACGRLSLAAEIVDRSEPLPEVFLHNGATPNPYLTIMEVMRIRLLGFQGQITDALALGEVSLAHSRDPLTELIAEATMCLVRGNAAQKSAVRIVADRLERAQPEPQDYLSSGCYLLVAFGLLAATDIARAARFVLLAGKTSSLDKLSILDRALGLDMLAAAAVAEGDLVAAEAWRSAARPLLDNDIARPTIQRLNSRVELLAGNAEEAERWALLALERCRDEGRAVEMAETEIVLSRARIASAQRGRASASLEALATHALSSGHLSARQSAARELRSIGRRLRPHPGSGFNGLSERERDVALLVVEGFGNHAIASELHLSEHTVQVHVSRVLAAFGVASRFALAAQLTALIPGDADAATPPDLTPRQNAVVDHIVRGLSNENIARELGVSVKTVEKHVSEIFRRWNVASRIGVTRKARSRL
ncbi:MAG: LuxR C-terminal-related transcriptional regulator [Microbacteriaceae bacterium]